MKKYIFALLAFLPILASAQIVPDYLRHPTTTGTANQFVQYPTAGAPATNAQPAFSNLSGSVACSQEPAYTGDVTTSAGSCTTALGNIPNATTAAGDIVFSNSAAPSSPSSGKDSVYTDSTDLRFHDKNASGTIGTTVVADTGASNNYISAISAAGVISKSRPTCSTASDSSIFCAATGINNPQTGTYQVLAGDFTNLKNITVASGTFTITLVASGSQPANGTYITVINYGSGVVTIARSGQNINGGTSSLTLSAGSATAPTSSQIWSDGTNYFANIHTTSPLTTKGDVYGYNTGNARIAVGADGRALVADSANALGVVYAPTATDYRYGYFEQDHFFQGVNIAGNKTKSSVSGGAGASVTAKTGLGAMHSGSWALQTRATNDLVGLWGIGVSNSGPFFAPGDGTYEVDWWFDIDTLSTATETFRVNFGLYSTGSPIGGAGSYGFVLNYQSNGTPAGKTSILVYVNGTIQTQVQGTTTIAAGTWYRVRMVADIVNANIKEYLFVPGGTETLEATYTGTMPTTTPMAPFAEMFRSLGTTGTADRVIYTTGWQVVANYATQQ